MQLLQALTDNDKEALSTFCVDFLDMTSDDESLMSNVVFSVEATFHASDEVNTHHCRVCSLENPRASLELQRDSPMVAVFCASSEQKV